MAPPGILRSEMTEPTASAAIDTSLSGCNGCVKIARAEHLLRRSLTPESRKSIIEFLFPPRVQDRHFLFRVGVTQRSSLVQAQELTEQVLVLLRLYKEKPVLVSTKNRNDTIPAHHRRRPIGPAKARDRLEFAALLYLLCFLYSLFLSQHSSSSTHRELRRSQTSKHLLTSATRLDPPAHATLSFLGPLDP